MNPGLAANTYQGVIAASSTYGLVDAISADEITTTNGANPGIATDPLALTLSSSARTFAHARMSASSRVSRTVSLGTIRTGALATAIRKTSSLGEPDDRGSVRSFLALRRHQSISTRTSLALRRTAALPSSLGSTNSFWVGTAAIGQGGTTYTAVPATLRAVSNHGYIWIDSTLSLSQASIAQIAVDFDNAYASDAKHFGTPEYTAASLGAQEVVQPCDASGKPISGAAPVSVFIPPANGMHAVFVINTQALGNGVGGYFSFWDFLPQAVANCIAGQPRSNEASMINVGYNIANGDTFEVNEDLVRGTSHELQHLINFVNHAIISNGQLEDTWINEGLSMLAQDFAVHALFPRVPIDATVALSDAQVFLSNPQNYSLTGFTGIDPNSGALAYDCSGCYGASYLFQRYLYDQYGGDSYTQRMESGGTVSYAGLQAQTGQTPATLIKNFSVALAVSNSGISNAPQYNFVGFNPYGTYTDQFGQVTQLAGPGVTIASPGTTTNYEPYLGTFAYTLTQAGTGQGSGVTLTDQGGNFGLNAALIQF